MTPKVAPYPVLQGRVNRLQLFALGFGSIVGSAWVVILGQWLQSSGPGGAILGFVAGGLVMIAIGACYAELTARIPRTGGEFAFALAIFGRKTAFFAGWFTGLGWICITVFEGLAVAWALEMLLPRLPDMVLYRAFDSPVTRNQLISGAIATILIALVNLRGGTVAARFQSVLTYGFLVIALFILLLMVIFGNIEHMTPLVQNTGPSPWWKGSLGIFASCAFLLNGFQTIAQVVEERSSTVQLRSVALIMVCTLAAGTLFYCLTVSASSLVLPWQQLAGADLAMVAATRALPFGNILATILLLVLLASLLKTWNGVFLAGSRVLLSLSREGFLPVALSKLDPKSGAPRTAVLATGALNLLGLLFGRGAVSFLVDTSALSFVLCFVLFSIGVWVLRRRQGSPAEFQVPGTWIIVFATLGAVAMAMAAVITPLLRFNGFPLEYLILLAWAVLGGLLYYRPGRFRNDTTELS